VVAPVVHDTRTNGHGCSEITGSLGTSPDEVGPQFDRESPIADRQDGPTAIELGEMTGQPETRTTRLICGPMRQQLSRWGDTVTV